MVDRSLAPASVPFSPFEIKQVASVFLDNGVPVHFLQSGNQKILRLEFVFNAGSSYEKLKGLSYLTSKMLPEGSWNFTSKEIADYIATYGAFMEIHPGFENVNFTFFFMEKHLEKLLSLISELIMGATFPAQELQNLKNITVQSLRVNKEKTQFLASAEFRKVLFSESHPYGKQYWEDDIEAVDEQHIRDFASQYINLSELEIFLSGQFDLTDTTEILNQYFGIQKISKSVHANESPSPILQGPTEVLIKKAGAIQSSIRIGSHTIPRNNPDYIPLSVTNEVLGGYFGSRLMRNIREDKGFTYGIHSSIHTLKKGAYFVISTDVKIENTRQTLQEVNKEILKLRNEILSEEELEVVKSYMLGRFMNSINTPFSLMDKFKTLHYSGLDYSFYGSYVDSIQNVNPEDVQSMAVKYLDERQFVQVVVGGMDNL